MRMRLRRRTTPALLVLAFVLLCAGCTAPSAGTVAPPTMDACPAGDGTPIDGLAPMSLPCLAKDGTAMSVTALHGRAEVINFWASWCSSCTAELTLLARTHQEIGDRALILGVDTKDSQDAALDAIAGTGATYPQVLDPPGAFALKMDVFALPLTVFVDANGTVVDRVFGPLTSDRLAAGLSRIGVTVQPSSS
jgi:cytochrome c biogenesis protein CcmG/thiol:disulfide interchange protein DsbE